MRSSAGKSCSVCAHAQRYEIERRAPQIDPGSEAEIEFCQDLGITRHALTRHLRDHRQLRNAPLSTPGPQREPGDAATELRASLRSVIAACDDPNVTATQRANLERAKLSILREIRIVEEGRPIHEHKEFPGLVEDLVSAVLYALGPDAPDGIEELIAVEFERLQSRRSEGTQKRKAA